MGEKLEIATKLVLRASRFALGSLREPPRCFLGHRAVCGLRRQVHQAEGTTAAPDLYTDAMIKTSFPMLLQSRRSMRARLLERTGRFAYLMLRHRYARPHHEQFEHNLGKLARGGPYGKDQGGKGQQKGTGKGKGQEKGKGSKAKAHREV